MILNSATFNITIMNLVGNSCNVIVFNSVHNSDIKRDLV